MTNNTGLYKIIVGLKLSEVSLARSFPSLAVVLLEVTGQGYNWFKTYVGIFKSWASFVSWSAIITSVYWMQKHLTALFLSLSLKYLGYT